MRSPTARLGPRPGEYAPHLTSRACGLLLAAAQELFKYKRDEGGFTGWLATRLPFIPQRSAYQAIEIFNGLDNEMFANFANIRPGALEQIAKAEPDIQALIAERIEAGEIFTAAKVKEIPSRSWDSFPLRSSQTERGLRHSGV